VPAIDGILIEMSHCGHDLRPQGDRIDTFWDNDCTRTAYFGHVFNRTARLFSFRDNRMHRSELSKAWLNLAQRPAPKTLPRLSLVQTKRLAPFFKPFWKHSALLIVLVSTNALLALVPALLTMRIVDQAIPKHDFQLLIWLVSGMITAAVVSALLTVLSFHLRTWLTQNVLFRFRCTVYSHTQKLPMNFLAKGKTGALINRVASDVDSLSHVVSGVMVDWVTNTATLIGASIALLCIDWRLALIAAIAIPVMSFPMFPVGRKLYQLSMESRKQRDEMLNVVHETLSSPGLALVKNFGREDYEGLKFEEVAHGLLEREVAQSMFGRWFFAAISLLGVFATTMIWFFGGWLAMSKACTVGSIITFLALCNRAYAPATALTSFRAQLAGAQAIFDRIFEYLDYPDEFQEDCGKNELQNLHGTVDFENVCFSYDNEKDQLTNANFHIEAGQLAALVGPSGAGKTTITRLLAGLYSPKSGRILMDGTDVSTVTKRSVRQRIGTVTQEPHFFHDTIRNNLRYGKLDATLDEIEAAAKLASVHDFVMTLPQGYETVVGPHGYKLSGGERQRLAIARVMLTDPQILVLDEATSSLDSLNESAIQEAILPAISGRTTLVIAHRLSTILHADVIFVVDRGTIIATGSHQELLGSCPLYFKLYNQQFRAMIPSTG
jgi:ATP-binding cassette subfamily B protein